MESAILPNYLCVPIAAHCRSINSTVYSDYIHYCGRWLARYICGEPACPEIIGTNKFY